MGRKGEKKLSFEAEFVEQDENRLKVRPEDIVRLRDEQNELPKEYNPYGRCYKVTLPKFLGDEPPCDQFREDGSKLWEVINDGDDVLKPVYFSMPEPPKRKYIANYGLPKDEQYFRRLEVPHKFKLIEQKALRDLQQLEKNNRQETVQGYKFYLRFWEIVEEEQENLVDEMAWLRKIWWCRTYGYWFLNDGEPTYIPPDYFDFLNFYYIEEAQCYPEYRHDVRRKYCYAWYLESCTETFKHLDSSGRALKNDQGKYEMIDLKRRVFFGDCEPKTRRTGATHEALHKILKASMTNVSYFSTIISFEGDNAETHYKKKLLPAFERYPMCLKPMWEGNRRPKILRLDAPPNVYMVQGLRSAIAYSDSAGVFKNDGDRLNGVVNDEQGKPSGMGADIFERWHVNKYTMATGMGINILKGVYVKNPSTVEQMDSGSAPYKKMCDMSDFYTRIPGKGQTVEGFARIFLPAYLRLEGYIDKFGKSVIEKPTERQIRLSPNAIFAMGGKGAREDMQAERDALLQANTPESLELYRSIRRKSPFKWSECWLGSAGNVGLNVEIIDKRLAEINKDKSFNKPPYRTGNLVRQDKNNPNSNVVWVDDTEHGRFDLSYMPPTALQNQKILIDYFDPIRGLQKAWKPVNGHRFTIGCDPFKSLRRNEVKEGQMLTGNASNSRQSDGGIVVYWEYDRSVDRDKPRKDRITDRVVCTYRARPLTQEEYFEDCISAAQFFGGMLFPEVNVDRIISYIIDRGYWGYFLYQIDPMTGKPKSDPGVYNAADTWQNVLPLFKDYVEFRGHAECHDKLLNELKKIRGVESMTHLDMASAFGMALLGSMSRHREIISSGNSQPTNRVDISSIFGMKRI